MLLPARRSVVASVAAGLTLSLAPSATVSAGAARSGADATVLAAAAQKAPAVRQDARVVRVVDGDTLLVRLRDGSEERVRILGIDTPEVHGSTECWGPQASKATKKLLPAGAKVRLTSDPTQKRVDDYDRQLRYVTRRKDGLDIGRHLIRKGHATTFIWRTNPLKRAKKYRATESAAKKARRGLWGAC